jgi:hypothetical protein
VDLKTLKSAYKQAYADYQEGVVGKGVVRAEHRNIEFAIIRQEFICPTYLPPVAETFLRKDFDFGEYLSRCIADILVKLFSFSWLSYVLILIGIALWRIVIYHGELALYITFGVFPVVMILALVIIITKLNAIYSGLVPYCTEPDEIKFPKYNDLQIDPLFNIGKIK